MLLGSNLIGFVRGWFGCNIRMVIAVGRKGREGRRAGVLAIGYGGESQDAQAALHTREWV